MFMGFWHYTITLSGGETVEFRGGTESDLAVEMLTAISEKQDLGFRITAEQRMPKKGEWPSMAVMD